MWALEITGTQWLHCRLALCKTSRCSCGVHLETKQNLHAPNASPNTCGSFQGNDGQNGHEQALSCCVNDYQWRHVPSLRKAQSFLPPWAFTYGYWWTRYFWFSIVSLCGFLLPYLCPELTGNCSYNLISYFNYNTALQQWHYSMILVS